MHVCKRVKTQRVPVLEIWESGIVAAVPARRFQQTLHCMIDGASCCCWALQETATASIATHSYITEVEQERYRSKPFPGIQAYTLAWLKHGLEPSCIPKERVPCFRQQHLIQTYSLRRRLTSDYRKSARYVQLRISRGAIR